MEVTEDLKKRWVGARELWLWPVMHIVSSCIFSSTAENVFGGKNHRS